MSAFSASSTDRTVGALLSCSRALTALDVSGNELGSSCKVVAKALETNRTLKKLNVQGNAIGVESALTLADRVFYTVAHSRDARSSLAIARTTRVSEVAGAPPQVPSRTGVWPVCSTTARGMCK